MLLIEEYEKDYSALVAEITAMVGRVQIFGGGKKGYFLNNIVFFYYQYFFYILAEKKEVCSSIDSKFTEASELVRITYF